MTPDEFKKRQAQEQIRDMIERTTQRKFFGDAIGKFVKPEETPQLRGCGNPNCVQCNPDTVGKGLPWDGRSPPGWNSRPDAMAEAREAMRAAFGGRVGSMGPDGVVYWSAALVEEPKTEAYEAVEEYLQVAPEQGFDDIVGNEEALAQLRDAIEGPKLYAEVYAAYGLPMPKGAVLYGPPGCGKTMFARAAASQMRQLYGGKGEFICVSGSEIQSPFVGVTEATIKSFFTYAKEYKAKHNVPLLIFIDEADVLLPDRTGRVRKVAPWEESQVAVFLAEMNGVMESGAFVLLATNRLEVIDAAVLRDGRCDFKLKVNRPTPDAAKVILERVFKGTFLAPGVSEADCVFAAFETFYAPDMVIAEAHIVMAALNMEEVKFDHFGEHFLLSHAVSGAMLTSIPTRAARRAFTRDKAARKASGVTIQDVVDAVRDVYEENKGLDHTWALKEYEEAIIMPRVQEYKKRMLKK